MKIYIIILLIFHISLFAKENKILESQPEILFEYKKLSKDQTKVALQVKFNNAVLYLEQEEYVKAIKLFKQTQKLLKIPSFLNIGIAYYKLKSNNNAYLYLKKIYDVKEAASEDPYSYMSAEYYLYKITNDKKYIEDIIKIAEKKKRLTEYTKRLLVDVLIDLKQYDKALNIIKDMEYPLHLKKALLYIKIRNYEMATIQLNKALKLATNNEVENKILWIKAFTSLKANNFAVLADDFALIMKKKRIFETHLHMPIKLFFNNNIYTTKQYFNTVTKFDKNRKIDFIFYFAPYIFADNDAIKVEENKAFILKNQSENSELNQMIKYNDKFISLIKKDPIDRTTKLQKIITQNYDTQAYEYYNLGLSYAQIDDFHMAYKYFNKAYGLNKANKLYAAMTLISAKRVKFLIPKREKERIVKNILSKYGTYHYFGQYIYKIIYDKGIIPKKNKLTYKFKKSIFFRGLYFLEHINEKGILATSPLLQEFDKDPLVHMFKLIARLKGESDYQYISRIQDEIPIKYNNLFIKGSLIITRFYLDILKSMGMLHAADLDIDTDTSATYYRTKALVQLYNKKPQATIKIVEHLQDKYNLKDRYTYLLLIAALIENKELDNASVMLTIAKQDLKYDTDIEFLLGLNLLQEFKINSAMQYFKNKYNGDLIDFKLLGLDELLKEL